MARTNCTTRPLIYPDRSYSLDVVETACVCLCPLPPFEQFLCKHQTGICCHTCKTPTIWTGATATHVEIQFYKFIYKISSFCVGTTSFANGDIMCGMYSDNKVNFCVGTRKIKLLNEFVSLLYLLNWDSCPWLRCRGELMILVIW